MPKAFEPTTGAGMNGVANASATSAATNTISRGRGRSDGPRQTIHNAQPPSNVTISSASAHGQ